MNPDMKESRILELAAEHTNMWRERNKKFEDWFKLIILDDSKIRQTDMECVISNDPNTLYEKASGILCSGIAHRVPTDDIPNPETVDTNSISKFLSSIWESKDRIQRRRARPEVIKELVDFLLITGWYDVMAYGLPEDGLVAEVRNPAECFPMYGDSGLVSHFRVFNLNREDALRRVALNGWTLSRAINPRTLSVKVHDFWFLDDFNRVYNSILIDNKTVKPPTLMTFLEIPILSGVASGMPDRGVIMPGDQKWSSRVGRSIVVSNESLYNNLDRQLSFTQQIIRDTAQFKTLEKSSTDTPIVSPETINKRGAIFRMGTDEDVSAMALPPLPVEISLHGRTLEDMIQRGGFPWSIYGIEAAQMGAYAEARMSTAVKEGLKIYSKAMTYVLSEIDNIWLDAMRLYSMSIGGWAIPENIPPSIRVHVEVPANIPGDFIQRATLSRMISPEFRLSQKFTMQMLWPEIDNANAMIAAGRADEIMNHPAAKIISLVSSFKQKAQELIEFGDQFGADLFNKAAEMALQTLPQTLGLREAPPEQVGSGLGPIPGAPS